MDLEMVARAIQLIIAPAVLLTACCIFTNGLLVLYATIGERLRVTVRERGDLLRETEASGGGSLIAQERLEDIDLQILVTPSSAGQEFPCRNVYRDGFLYPGYVRHCVF